MTNTIRNTALGAAVSLLQFQAILSGLLPRIDALARTSSDVLAGTPALAAFQNRVAAPLIQRGIEMATGLPRNYAFLVLIFLSVAALNVGWIYWVSRAERERWLIYFVFSALWVLLADYQNFMPWDVTDLIVFSLLAFAIVDGWRLRSFVLLFIVALFNRETALFIGVWLILWAWGPTLDRSRLAVGAAMIAAGAVVVVILRKTLLVQSPLMGEVAGGTFLAFGRNWRRLVEQLTFPSSAPFLVFLVLTVASLIFLASSRALEPLYRRMALFAMVLIGAGLSFGIWNETRVFLMVAPLGAILTTVVISGFRRDQ